MTKEKSLVSQPLARRILSCPHPPKPIAADELFDMTNAITQQPIDFIELGVMDEQRVGHVTAINDRGGVLCRGASKICGLACRSVPTRR